MRIPGQFLPPNERVFCSYDGNGFGGGRVGVENSVPVASKSDGVPGRAGAAFVRKPLTPVVLDDAQNEFVTANLNRKSHFKFHGSDGSEVNVTCYRLRFTRKSSDRDDRDNDVYSFVVIPEFQIAPNEIPSLRDAAKAHILSTRDASEPYDWFSNDHPTPIFTDLTPGSMQAARDTAQRVSNLQTHTKVFDSSPSDVIQLKKLARFTSVLLTICNLAGSIRYTFDNSDLQTSNLALRNKLDDDGLRVPIKFVRNLHEKRGHSDQKPWGKVNSGLAKAFPIDAPLLYQKILELEGLRDSIKSDTDLREFISLKFSAQGARSDVVLNRTNYSINQMLRHANYVLFWYGYLNGFEGVNNEKIGVNTLHRTDFPFFADNGIATGLHRVVDFDELLKIENAHQYLKQLLTLEEALFALYNHTNPNQPQLSTLEEFAIGQGLHLPDAIKGRGDTNIILEKVLPSYPEYAIVVSNPFRAK